MTPLQFIDHIDTQRCLLTNFDSFGVRFDRSLLGSSFQAQRGYKF